MMPTPLLRVDASGSRNNGSKRVHDLLVGGPFQLR
jgi:hypothetical protein